MEQLHQHCKNCETRQYDQRSIVFYPRFQFRGHERKIFSPFNQKKVNNRSCTYTSEYSYLPFQVAPVIEREHHTGYELHHRSEEKGYRHRQEYSENHRQGFLRVKQVIKTETDAACHFNQCNDKGGTQQLKNH